MPDELEIGERNHVRARDLDRGHEIQRLWERKRENAPRGCSRISWTSAWFTQALIAIDGGKSGPQGDQGCVRRTPLAQRCHRCRGAQRVRRALHPPTADAGRIGGAWALGDHPLVRERLAACLTARPNGPRQCGPLAARAMQARFDADAAQHRLPACQGRSARRTPAGRSRPLHAAQRQRQHAGDMRKRWSARRHAPCRRNSSDGLSATGISPSVVRSESILGMTLLNAYVLIPECVFALWSGAA